MPKRPLPRQESDVKAEEEESGSPGNKRVRFDGVTAFYFQRSQGFSCVPSAGGITLGMSQSHHSIRRLSISEHESELKSKRQDAELGENSAEENEEEGEEEEREEEEEEEEGTFEDEEDSPQDSGLQQYYPQPLLTRERRALLRSSGVEVEKDDCDAIRKSRQTCGCACQGVCDPETCECAINGIQCQVDRPSFPCSCTAQYCHNPSGRVEFDPLRVRTHYFHTMLRVGVCEGDTVLFHCRAEPEEAGPPAGTEPVPLSALYAHQQPRLLVQPEQNDF